MSCKTWLTKKKLFQRFLEELFLFLKRLPFKVRIYLWIIDNQCTKEYNRCMNREMITWSEEKNQLLLKTRWVCFEQVLEAVEANRVLWDVKNHNYRNQRIMVVEIEWYVYNVPYVIDWENIFLKTLFPSRKSKKIYLN